MDVLDRMLEAVVSGGIVLDLQFVPPHPQVELDGRVIGEIDCGRLFSMAAAATAAVDARISAGELVEEAVDDHDLRKHYPNGADLVADVAGSERRLPRAFAPVAQAIEEPLVVRERCRLRRLRVLRSEV